MFLNDATSSSKVNYSAKPRRAPCFLFPKPPALLQGSLRAVTTVLRTNLPQTASTYQQKQRSSSSSRVRLQAALHLRRPVQTQKHECH